MSSLKSLLTFTASMLITLAVMDGYLQVAEIQTPMETRIDPHLGPTYIPGKPISRFNEGFFIGEANRYGYMGPAVPPRRRGSERRVLLIGDSFILGHTVLPRHHFGRTLEASLSRVTGDTVSALNFGKADFNFWNMYQYYLDFASTFDHDLALFFADQNDIVPSRQIASGLYPVLKLQADSLVVDTSFVRSRQYRFYKTIEPVFTRSAVMRLGFNSYKMVVRGELPGVLLGRFAPPRAPGRPDGAGLSPTRQVELPPLSRAVLQAMGRDPRNVLVIQKSLASELRAEVRACGLKMIDLGAYLDSLQAAGQDPYYWPVTNTRGHWNHAAHPLIGEYLARQLVGMGLVWPKQPEAGNFVAGAGTRR